MSQALLLYNSPENVDIVCGLLLVHAFLDSFLDHGIKLYIIGMYSCEPKITQGQIFYGIPCGLCHVCLSMITSLFSVYSETELNIDIDRHLGYPSDFCVFDIEQNIERHEVLRIFCFNK